MNLPAAGIGYLPVSREGAVLFFPLINARDEHASTVLTSNKGFEAWGSILGDEVMTATLIGRFRHHCHLANIRSSSYRMREHIDLLKPISPIGEPSETPKRTRRRKEATRRRRLRARHLMKSAQLSGAENVQILTGVNRRA